MSKYTTEPLQEMARQVQQFRDSRRGAQFVGALSHRTGVPVMLIDMAIYQIAEGLPCPFH